MHQRLDQNGEEGDWLVKMRFCSTRAARCGVEFQAGVACSWAFRTSTGFGEPEQPWKTR